MSGSAPGIVCFSASAGLFDVIMETGLATLNEEWSHLACNLKYLQVYLIKIFTAFCYVHVCDSQV